MALPLVLTALFAGCIDDPKVPQQSVGLPTAPTPPAPPAPTTPQPISGTLHVAVVTSGAELAPYGYAVMVDGAIASLTAPTAVTTLDLAPGAHEVRLGGVPLECARLDSDRRSVNVIAGGETTESFVIQCTAPDTLPPPPPVSVSVKVVSTGADIDPNGYFVQFEPQPSSRSAQRTGRQIAANDSIVLTVPSGSYGASLYDVASNCTVSRQSTLIDVKDPGVLVSFTVACSAIPDAQGVRITTVTTGTNPDTDGYTVDVANDLDMDPEQFAWKGTVASNGSVTVPKIRTGFFLVSLSGVAKNCIVIPSATVSAWVSAERMSPVQFQVLCFAPVNGP